MFRIRRIHDDIVPASREAIVQAEQLLRSLFPAAKAEDFDLRPRLHDPFRQQFRTILLVAEKSRQKLQGCAVMMVDPRLRFCVLDYLASAGTLSGRGVGAALYEHVREEAAAAGAIGLFFECLPDEPGFCANEDVIKQNAQRLKFYERFGARPIVNNDYTRPTRPGETCMPYLVYDGLDQSHPLRRDACRRIVRAFLERKYSQLCSPQYISEVVQSFRDDPVQLRDYRYIRPATVRTAVVSHPIDPIVLVVNDRHQIHHVRERGYVEAPARIDSILQAIEPTGLFQQIPPREFPERHIKAIHAHDLVEYLRRTSLTVPEGKSWYPYVFPIRNRARPPKEMSVLAGYYCIDTFTPLNRNAFVAARRAVDCTLTAAEQLLQGARRAYALVRPPGHHAEHRNFGGFCYFNNAAVAAQYLCSHGRVAILDIDYHHGNGQQEIFYNRHDVFTVSIHGDPRFAYPYFTGFADERGEGGGEGCNLNLPLPEKIDPRDYRRALARATAAIREWRAEFLIVCLGLDTGRGDPTGTWTLGPDDFRLNGRQIAELGLPTLIVQEGGYRRRTLGQLARGFFLGLSDIRPNHGSAGPDNDIETASIHLLDDVAPRHRERIRKLVHGTGFFTAAEIGIAVELIDERLAKGDASGYHFIVAEARGRVVGYVCFGPIAGTDHSYDLYWIAVDRAIQRRGIGRMLMAETERRVRTLGGQRIYIDTSLREDYASTRAFYERCGYIVDARLEDFYRPGDGKVIFVRALS